MIRRYWKDAGWHYESESAICRSCGQDFEWQDSWRYGKELRTRVWQPRDRCARCGAEVYTIDMPLIVVDASPKRHDV